MARVWYFFSSDARDIVRCNLARILDYTRGEDGGPERRRLVDKLARETFENFAVHIIDFFDIVSFDCGAYRDRLEKVGMENLEGVLAEGRGVIVVTAHIGNWELGPKVMTDMGHKFGAVEIIHDNKRLDKFFTVLRVKSGALMAHEGFEVRHMMKVLKQNGLATFVIDRDITKNGRTVRLFGEEMTFVRGAPEFSCKTGIPIVPGYLLQLEDGYFRLIFEDPIEPDRSLDKEAQLDKIYSKIARSIEEMISFHPSQWFIFHKIWP